MIPTIPTARRRSAHLPRRRASAIAPVWGALLVALTAMACSSPVSSSAPPASPAASAMSRSTAAPAEPAAVAEPANQPVTNAAAGDAGGDELALCSVLTTEEIAAIAGNPVEDAAAETVGCGWSSDPNETNIHLVRVPIKNQACISAFQEDPSNTPVDGLAAPAFWSFMDMGGGAGVMSICDGDTMLAVTISAGVDDEPDADALMGKARDVADAALARL